MPTLLFVYGTLRHGASGPMAEVLSRDAVCLGRGWVRGRLFDFGEFPGAIQGDGKGHIFGEVHELHRPEETLAVLDDYEGCAAKPKPLFKRVQVRVALDDGRSADAWIYFYCGPMTNARAIANGDSVGSPN